MSIVKFNAGKSGLFVVISQSSVEPTCPNLSLAVLDQWAIVYRNPTSTDSRRSHKYVTRAYERGNPAIPRATCPCWEIERKLANMRDYA